MVEPVRKCSLHNVENLTIEAWQMYPEDEGKNVNVIRFPPIKENSRVILYTAIPVFGWF